jgi:hypothetical protein
MILGGVAVVDIDFSVWGGDMSPLTFIAILLIGVVGFAIDFCGCYDGR